MANNNRTKTREELEKVKAENEVLREELERYERSYKALMREHRLLRAELALREKQFTTMEKAEFWRITKPFRWVLDLLKKKTKENKLGKNVGKVQRSIRERGLRYTIRRIQQKIHFRRVAHKKQYTAEELEQQKYTVFPRKIKISILVPLYNTPKNFLKEMLESVMGQTYAHWELCLADGSDSKHDDLEAYIKKVVGDDPRVLYKRLDKNYGIAGNTNACIEMASGEYIALFDHDDILHSAALYEVMCAICEKGADFIYTDENTFSQTPADAYCPHFKPDFSPDLLRSYNYICHLTVFKRALLKQTGVFRSEFNGSQDYDMILRLTEKARKIVHIPIILYYWRAHKKSVASDISAKPYTIEAAKHALAEHLERVGLEGTVMDSSIPSTYRIRYEIKDHPLVSIIIPNMDHVDVLDQCIQAIESLTTYPNYEILIVENNSNEGETFLYYDRICAQYKNIRLLRWHEEFNYSKINNFAFGFAKGEYVILMNNDVEIITPEWIEEMLMFVQRKDVGAAGMMLYYPDDTVQHAGVILGIGGVAGHSHKYFKRGDYGYMSRMTLAQNLSAVTAACMMVKSSVWKEVEGLEEELAVAFNDVDLCVKIREAGHLIVFTPYAEAYHHESKSRGMEDTPEKQQRFYGETMTFLRKWEKVLNAGDPYYNPNLTLKHENFSLKEE